MGEAIEYSEVRCGKMPFNNWMDEGLIMDEERDDPGLLIANPGSSLLLLFSIIKSLKDGLIKTSLSEESYSILFSRCNFLYRR